MSKKCYLFSSGLRFIGQICMQEVFLAFSSLKFRRTEIGLSEVGREWWLAIAAFLPKSLTKLKNNTVSDFKEVF